MSMDPDEVAEALIRTIERHAFLGRWKTEQLAAFWQRMTEECTVRLIRLRPELVRRWPPEESQ